MDGINSVITENFKVTKKLNILGVKNIISDIKDFSTITKTILLGIGIISIFLSFFDINHFINKENDPSVWSIENQLGQTKIFLGSMPKWIDVTLYCLSGLVSFTGILNVYLTCFGKISSYFWGIINVVVMGLFAFDYGYTGEAQINLLIYLPFQFIGWYTWKNSMIDGQSSSAVVATRKTNGYIAIAIMAIAGAIISVAWYYEIVWFHHAITGANYDYINQKFPHSFDSIENSLGVVGIISQSLRLKEQWFVWFITDVIMLFMYCGGSSIGAGQGQGVSINLNMIIQTSIFIASCYIGWVIWSGKMDPYNNWFTKKQNNINNIENEQELKLS